MDLIARPEIDEVVIIISGRSRLVPGTLMALEPIVARDVWSIYLEGIDGVKIEIAPQTAVQHALSYMTSAKHSDELVYCLGETDLSRGDRRFDFLHQDVGRGQPKARVIAAATSALRVRSCDLRTALSLGVAGRAPFMDLLPTQLDRDQKATIWELCSRGMRSIADITRDQLLKVLKPFRRGEFKSLELASSASIDPVYRLTTGDGTCMFVKHAGNSLDESDRQGEQVPKHRERLSVEKRALRRLRTRPIVEVELPEVLHFDRATKTMILSEVCLGGHLLVTDLMEGRFSALHAEKVGLFLARCHRMPSEVKPLWGDRRADDTHWQKVLNHRTSELKSQQLTTTTNDDLDRLAVASQRASAACRNNQLLLLSDLPEHLVTLEEHMGAIHFESASVVGDPACDIGWFLSHYLFWGTVTANPHSSTQARQRALAKYITFMLEDWQEISPRVDAFIGAGLCQLWRTHHSLLSEHTSGLIRNQAAQLLATIRNNPRHFTKP